MPCEYHRGKLAMALIGCQDCARKISDKADACSDCGAPVSFSEISKKDRGKRIRDICAGRTQSTLDKDLPSYLLLQICVISISLGAHTQSWMFAAGAALGMVCLILTPATRVLTGLAMALAIGMLVYAIVANLSEVSEYGDSAATIIGGITFVAVSCANIAGLKRPINSGEGR